MTPRLSLSQHLGWVFNPEEPDIHAVPASGLAHYPHRILSNSYVRGDRSYAHTSLGFVKGSKSYLISAEEVSQEKLSEQMRKLKNSAYQEQIRYRLRHCHDYITPDWQQKYGSVDKMLDLFLLSLEDDPSCLEWKVGKGDAMESVCPNYHCFFENKTDQYLEIGIIQMGRRKEGATHFRSAKRITRIVSPGGRIGTTLIIPSRETAKTSYVGFMVLVGVPGQLLPSLEDIYNVLGDHYPHPPIPGSQWACAKYWLKIPPSKSD